MKTYQRYLNKGVIWKATEDGSRLYVPAIQKSISLDSVSSRELLELQNNEHQSFTLSKLVDRLLQDEFLVIQEKFGRPLILNRETPRLDYVVLRLTNACNLRCKHCFVSSGQISPDELSFDEIETLLRDIAKFEPLVIVLTGGEPFLHPDLFKIIASAFEQNMAVDISTNGLFIDDEVIKRLKLLNNLRYIILSLDGHNANHHDYIRGNGNFEHIVKIAKKLKRANIRFSVNHCVTADNIDHLSQTIDLALQLGASSVHLATVSASGRANDHWSRLALNYEQRRQISIIQMQKFLETGRVFAGEAEREVSGFPHGNTKVHNCGVGRDWCMIYANGDVTPCRPVYSAIGPVGNIRENSFNEIWQLSPLLNQLRNICADQIPKCSSCRWLDRCKAGCRARAYQEMGSWTASENETFCQEYHKLNIHINQLMVLALQKKRYTFSQERLDKNDQYSDKC